MKIRLSFFMKMAILLLATTVLSSMAYGQRTIRGTVTDEDTGEPLIGANLLITGTSSGTITDFDGNFELEIQAGQNTLEVSYTGYTSKTVVVGAESVLNITLAAGTTLEEIVVVGYGTTQTKDLTGSVVSVREEDFQRGNFSTPEQLVAGKIAGVKINSNSGAPGSGSRIRIRGGTSLNASNDPLIVIDGVPLDNAGISGSANALNLINPSEIESITVLKDASAAAIYGSRAANGVLLITTKKGKGSKKLSVNVSTNNTVSTLPQLVDVLNADEYRTIVNELGSQNQKNRLGEANTDWQSEIYRNAISSQNNLTLSGGIQALPYRLNLEYFYNEGILKRSQLNRYGASLNLSPTMLSNQVRFDVNGKFSQTYNFFADQGAIGSAVSFNPTSPIYSDTTLYGGYFEWLANNGRPNPLAPRNPLGLLNQRDDESTVNRFIGNAKVDYLPTFLPGFTATLNLGMDLSRSAGTVFVPAEAASSFLRGGVNNRYEQSKDNRLLEIYGNYNIEVPSIASRFDLTAGYSYQNWLTKSPAQPDLNVAGDTIAPPGIPFETENTLISFYGRLNYNLKEKYLLTITLREDGSSRFSPDTRWGLFPSVAAAWRISEEPFLKGSKLYMKLRAGWGVTGQQDIGNDYPYIPNYDQSTPTAQYQFGDKFYSLLRPDGYDANIKWEETTSLNLGLDFGFDNNKIFAALDFYRKTTEDLLAVIPVPAGTNFTNQILTNVGSLQNTGAELTLSYVPVHNRDWMFELSGNLSYNINEITQLTKASDPNDPGILVGGIPGGIGNTVQIHTVGYPAFSYLVYQQLYQDGNPVEDEYVDLDGVEGIAPGRSDLDLGDQYIFDGYSEPNLFAGLSGMLSYRKWSLGFTMRGEFGQYIYNGVAAQRGFFRAIDPQSALYINNLTSAYYESNFFDGDVTQFLSDFYLEKGDFVRMDNITLGYDFGEIGKNVLLRANASVQNAFVWTQYSGIDPEIVGSIDNNIYPRPRMFSLNIILNL